MEKKNIIIVDENDTIIGYKKREELNKSDRYRVSALRLTNTQWEILLAQRAFTKKKSPWQWWPAVAGTVEEGETYESNIIKEAEEEIGLTWYDFIQSKKREYIQIHTYRWQRFTVIVDKPIEQFVIQEEEVEQVKRFSKEELQQALYERPEEFLDSMQWCIDTFRENVWKI